MKFKNVSAERKNIVGMERENTDNAREGVVLEEEFVRHHNGAQSPHEMIVIQPQRHPRTRPLLRRSIKRRSYVKRIATRKEKSQTKGIDMERGGGELL